MKGAVNICWFMAIRFRHEYQVSFGQNREYIHGGKMAKGKTLCNLCSKEFNEWDEQENFGIHTRVGYGSRFDGDNIDLDLCCECFDKLMGRLVSECKINPIIENN